MPSVCFYVHKFLPTVIRCYDDPRPEAMTPIYADALVLRDGNWESISVNEVANGGQEIDIAEWHKRFGVLPPFPPDAAPPKLVKQ